MDHPDGLAKRKPVFDARAFDRLVSGPVMDMWSGLCFFGAFLHAGRFCRPPLCLEEDS